MSPHLFLEERREELDLYNVVVAQFLGILIIFYPHSTSEHFYSVLYSWLPQTSLFKIPLIKIKFPCPKYAKCQGTGSRKTW